MGLIYYQPDHEKINLKPIDAFDTIHEKFLEMISNDNDAAYVMNALPEFRDMRKEDENSGRDFISGKVTRLSGIFENITVDKIMGPLKKVPMYYSGQTGKNLVSLKIGLLTKFKVQVDLGFLQYSLDGDKITIFRIYISKIYRRMNYLAFAYLEIFKILMEKHPAADRWSIFVLERNQNVHKFFKFLGLKIDKIITDSKVKNQVDYYQEFNIKKKDLQTAVASFKWSFAINYMKISYETKKLLLFHRQCLFSLLLRILEHIKQNLKDTVAFRTKISTITNVVLILKTLEQIEHNHSDVHGLLL